MKHVVACVFELPPQQSCSPLFFKRGSYGGWVEVEICGMLLSKKLFLFNKRKYPKGVGVGICNDWIGYL